MRNFLCSLRIFIMLASLSFTIFLWKNFIRIWRFSWGFYKLKFVKICLTETFFSSRCLEYSNLVQVLSVNHVWAYHWTFYTCGTQVCVVFMNLNSRHGRISKNQNWWIYYEYEKNFCFFLINIFLSTCDKQTSGTTTIFCSFFMAWRSRTR